MKIISFSLQNSPSHYILKSNHYPYFLIQKYRGVCVCVFIDDSLFTQTGVYNLPNLNCAFFI